VNGRRVVPVYYTLLPLLWLTNALKPRGTEDLVDSFGGHLLKSLDLLGEGSLGEFFNQHDQEATVRVVISTLPAGAKFILPEWIYERSAETKPVIFDVNYKPYNTDLLRQADSTGCTLVRGSEMLWEQGAGQFELWMERTAPYCIMKQVVLENCVEAMSQV
jgi:shikimate 5-dehydrogenase